MPEGAHRVEVRVQPRASRDEVVGWRSGRLLVRVTAAPVDDRANEALRRLVAKRAGVARSAVRLVRGSRSRDKLLEISGLDAPPAELTPPESS
jgi:uncharacterized protein (TIGR00251 family)